MSGPKTFNLNEKAKKFLGTEKPSEFRARIKAANSVPALRDLVEKLAAAVFGEQD